MIPELFYPFLYFGIGFVLSVAFWIYAKLAGIAKRNDNIGNICALIMLAWAFYVVLGLLMMIANFIVKVILKRKRL